jgi:hypothetical protein
MDHLRILSILHYVFGALSAFYCSFPLIHVTIGAFMISGAFPGVHEEDMIIGWCFVLIGGTIVLAGWAFAGLVFFAGYSMSRRKRYMLCFLTACLSCMHVPLGTVLGIFTIIVLARPSVKEMFTRAAEPQAGPAADLG